MLNSSQTKTIDELKFADYNGNGTTNVIFEGIFYGYRHLFYFDGGSGSWRIGAYLNNRQLADIAFGQFDSDAYAEVIHDAGNGVEVHSLNGASWQALNDYLGVAPYTVGSQNVLGDFGGNGLTDIFATRYW